MNRSGVYVRTAVRRSTERKGKLRKGAYRFVAEAALFR